MVVSLHNATTTPTGLELVYSVRVSGKLVPAPTAAGDMRLLTDKEVTAELGYPLVTKAEREYCIKHEQLRVICVLLIWRRILL